MSLKLMVKKLQMYNKRFITREELKEYCREINLDYYTAIRYLTFHKYLIRILKGIFYIKSMEERKFNKTNINYLDAIKTSLRIKGVKKWYFGLETALKLNTLTHEYFTIDYVINDTIFRANPINILGHKIKFVKISSKLFYFGIKKDKLPYSDPEKTMLDLLYLKKYNKTEFLELSKRLSKNKILKYAEYYNKKVRDIVRKQYDKHGIY